MARLVYGGSSSDVVFAETGGLIPNAPINVFFPDEEDPSQPSAVQATDLQDAAGNATPTPVADQWGFIRFKGPDGYTGILYADAGIGPKVALYPVLGQNAFTALAHTMLGQLANVDLTDAADNDVLTKVGGIWVSRPTQSARMLHWRGVAGVGEYDTRPAISESNQGPWAFESEGDPLAPPPPALTGEWSGVPGSLWRDKWYRAVLVETP